MAHRFEREAETAMMHTLLALIAMMATLSEALPEKRIALSFDDAPRQRGAFLTPDERTEKLILALKVAGVTQAAFFVNPAHLDTSDGEGGEARLAAYVAVGHVLANHTFRHPNLLNVTAEAFLAEIDETEAWLRDRPGYRPWFRFPYLNEGGRDKAKRDAVRAGLRARGLSNGHASADGSDWSLEALTVEAAKAGKTMDMEALRRLYVTSQMSGIAYHDELARRTLGRSPAHVMLLHETDLAALFIGDLVEELKRHGWTIITMDEAYSDPFYQIEPDVPYASGTLTGSVAWQQDVKPPLWPIWLSTESMKDLFQRRVVREALPPPVPPKNE